MRVKTEDREGLFKALTVEVEGNPVERALQEVYIYLQENVEIKGFRKGTAPLWLIRAKYKDYIEEEVGKIVANETLQEAIEESKLTPVADIYLEKVELDEKTPKVTYTVSFEIPPSVELKDIEGLEVEVPKLEMNESFLQEEIAKLKEEHAVWEPVQDRPIREGDLVSVEYEVRETKEGGEEVRGETSGIVGLKMFREELEKALIGKKVGDEVILEDLPIYEQTGKEVGRVNMKVKVKEVKQKVLPEENDDFAKELGYESWEEAKKRIEEKAKEEFERSKRATIEGAVSEKLVSIHEIEVPKTLVRRELSFLMERWLRWFQSFGIDTRYLNYRSMAAELLPQAEANVKLRYILDKYAEVKGVEVTEEDIERELEEIAKDTGRTKEEVRESFEKENLMDVIREDARRRKALMDIISKVKIVEVEEKEEETSQGGEV